MSIEYGAFIVGYTAGDAMTIVDDRTSLDDLTEWVFNSKALWYYDGEKYRVVIHFEALEDAAVIYFFDDAGNVCGRRYGGDD